MKRTTLIFRTVLYALFVVSTLVATSTCRADETFGYTSKKPQLWETPRPVLEEDSGTNLYWQDPYLGSWEMCRWWMPGVNGCPPRWYARADVMPLFRNPKQGYSFATLGADGPVALSTSDFRSEFDAGLRVTIGKPLGDWYRLEFTYAGAQEWNDQVGIRNTDPNDQGGIGNLFSPFSNFGDPDATPQGIPELDYNEFVGLSFSSRLNSGELNLRRRILMRPGKYEASFLVGGRYMEISEQFGYFSDSGTPVGLSNDVSIRTNNEMIGFQIGLLSQFLVQPKYWVDFEMKGGIFQNRVSLDRLYTAVDAGGLPTDYAGTDELDRTSFVGELSLQWNYQFAPSWTLYLGYNAMWVTGLALGADNFENNIDVLTDGPTLMRHSGQMVYHGPNFGIVFSR
jgi:hypothetical protein